MRTLAATALVLASVLALAGCTPSSSSTASHDTTPPATSARTLAPAVVPTPGAALHPTGPASAWLDDGYGRGLGETWNAGGEICVVIDDVAVVARSGDLVGRRIGTDEVVWTMAGESGCARDDLRGWSTRPPAILVRESDERSPRRWTVRDLATGDTSVTIEMPREIRAELVGADDATAYLIEAEHSLHMIEGPPAVVDLVAYDGDGVERWRVHDAGTGCRLVTTYLHCRTSAPDGRVDVLRDASTGERLSDVSADVREQIVWLNDGYAVIGEEGGEVFSTAGGSLGLIAADPHLERSQPGPDDGVLLSTVDVLNAVKAPRFAHDGRVIWQESDGPVGFMTHDGRVVTGAVSAVSADGATLLMGESSGPMSALVREKDRSEIDALPDGVAGDLVGGLLRVGTDALLLPRDP